MRGTTRGGRVRDRASARAHGDVQHALRRAHIRDVAGEIIRAEIRAGGVGHARAHARAFSSRLERTSVRAV